MIVPEVFQRSMPKIKKRKKRKGIHSKNNKPSKKYRGQGR